jgi:hypothetical protein
MTAPSSKPSEQRWKLFQIFGAIGKGCLSIARWFVGPKVFRWSEERSKSPDLLTFRSGGEGSLVASGIVFFVPSVFIGFVFLVLGPAMVQELRNAFAQGEYGRAALFYFALTLFSVAVLGGAFLGLWKMFGRTIIFFEKTTGIIAREYRLLTLRLFQKTYDLQEASSVIFRANSLFKSFSFPKSIYLGLRGEIPLKLIDVPQRFESEGREIARRMAEFIGVPGPVESDLVDSQKPD